MRPLSSKQPPVEIGWPTLCTTIVDANANGEHLLELDAKTRG
jgi:hypothetical protein